MGDRDREKGEEGRGGLERYSILGRGVRVLDTQIPSTHTRWDTEQSFSSGR